MAQNLEIEGRLVAAVENQSGGIQVAVRKGPQIDTLLAQAGCKQLDCNGAISTPIYQTATFRHPGLGQSTGYDYSRSGNPTRAILEDCVAELEGGCKGFAFASGMAGISALLMILRPSDHILVSEDLYGGTYRLLERIFVGLGLRATYVDTSRVELVEEAIGSATKMLLVETPSNPLMRISDLASLASVARRHGVLSVADNTFMTPYLQRPLEMGWDVVVHSASKYLAGHNDVVAGLVAAKDEDVAEKIGFVQNAAGAVLGPQDCWLTLRGLKTLALRMDRAQENALAIAKWLERHPAVEKVYYPGVNTHPGYVLQRKQASGPGAMLAFNLHEEAAIARVLGRLRLIAFAESLGGVESLITFPARQTHADMPAEVRESLGISERLLRLSVGIEGLQDLLHDLEQALE